MKTNDAPVPGVKPTLGITPEQARDARARAWAFVFECFYRHEKEAVCGRGGEDDASEEFTHQEWRQA
jgi:hypothetical protein